VAIPKAVAFIGLAGISPVSPEQARRKRNVGQKVVGKRFDKAKMGFNLRAILVGVVAQLVEHHNGIVGVRGSNPLGSTKLKESAAQASR
jgi:hypothetical protein